MDKILLDPNEQLYFQIMEDLNKPRGDGELINLPTRLHAGQIKCLSSMYTEGKKLVFGSCGRKFGKSEMVGYALWRHALLNPGSACYYIAPEASHGRKIMWDTRRLQNFLGKDSKKYIEGNPNNLEMKIKFRNGSFIQITGSENWASANGLTPDMVVYDEFKVFHPQFHIEMDPNRAAKAAPLFIIGTMPKVGDRNKPQYEALLEYAKMNPNKAAVHTMTTFDNPINLLPDRKEAIEEQISILRARGDEDVVQREYFSKIVPGGSRAIFPMMSKEAHVRPHRDVVKEVSRDARKLEWYCVADPGTTTCFAVLIIALNPYTRKIYVVDEIYEKDQEKTSVRSIYPKMRELMLKYNPHGSIDDDWTKVSDEAAAWFMNEIMQQYGTYFMPTDKIHNKKEHGLSLTKDILIHDAIVISDRCEHLFKEMQEYSKDDKGNIPKRNDHLIDCFRYFLGTSNYNMVELLEAIRQGTEPIKKGRHRKFSDELDSMEEDWVDNIFLDY